MAKSNNYKITLYPAHKEESFVVTKFEMLAKYPEQEVSAAGMPDLVDKVTHFAMAHGEGCRASVRCLAPRKPPGFKKATENLYFNLTEQPLGTASAA